MRSPFRRKSPSAHGAVSLLRLFFPHTRARARAQLSKLRHKTLPSLKHRAQSRIYKYIVYRQAQKLQKKSSILQRLRGHTRKLLGSGYLEDAARLRRKNLELDKSTDPAGMSSYQGGESGGRRRKLAG